MKKVIGWLILTALGTIFFGSLIYSAGAIKVLITTKSVILFAELLIMGLSLIND